MQLNIKNDYDSTNTFFAFYILSSYIIVFMFRPTFELTMCNHNESVNNTSTLLDALETFITHTKVIKIHYLANVEKSYYQFTDSSYDWNNKNKTEKKLEKI